MITNVLQYNIYKSISCKNFYLDSIRVVYFTLFKDKDNSKETPYTVQIGS